MNRALIIVAHGSSVNPASAESVVDAAARLASRPDISAQFDTIEARFLKQPPLLDDADFPELVVVIPFFMSEGYFVGDVLPRHLPPHARITRALGACRLDDVVRASVERFAHDAHLVLVGHGTDRSDKSAATVLATAERLRADMRSVTCAFVDQDPRLDTTWARVPNDGAPVVVLPYFAFAGPHTEDDIPLGLQLADASVGPHQIGGHTVHYAPPVGISPEVVDVLAALALHHLR